MNPPVSSAEPAPPLPSATHTPIRVLIADDHALMRAGLQRIIDSQSALCVSGMAMDGVSTLARIEDTSCDVLLLDLAMPAPSGPELIGLIRRRKPDLPLLVISMHNDPSIVRASLQAGASGYITKDSDPDILVQALRCVMAGEHYIESRLMKSVLFDPATIRPPVSPLSPRERQVLQRLAVGQSNSEIALALFISEKTVSCHKMNLMNKLGINSMVELLRYADQHWLDENAG